MRSAIIPAAASLPQLTVARQQIFVGGQLAETARSSRVNLVGANTNLCPQPQFTTVVQARAGVHHDGR